MNTTTSLRFENITKDYGTGEPAVNNISFVINEGELVTLLGPSGCGKTTTLRMIAGLEMPTKGKIYLGNQDVTSKSAAQRNVSLVFQSYALFPHMNVMDNVCYGLSVQGKPADEAKSKADEVLKLIGLTGYEARLPSELSGGQQQRVAIARALVLQPAVLLFDEPLSNLDARLRRHVREEIRELQQRLAITCVYVTHDREEALAVSDQIIVMNKGLIAEQGSAQQLFYHPKTAFVADFLAEANVVEGTVTEIDNAMTKLNIADTTVTVKQAPHHRIGNCRIALRPDAFSLTGNASDPHISGEIGQAAFVGRGLECIFNSKLGEIFVFLPKQSTLTADKSLVNLYFSPESVHIVE